LAKTLSGSAQENLRIELCPVLGRMPDPIDLAGVGTGDEFRVFVEECGADGRSADVDGQNGRVKTTGHKSALSFKF
jgi:hypothetical protein